jgi:hypothetical protein
MKERILWIFASALAVLCFGAFEPVDDEPTGDTSRSSWGFVLGNAHAYQHVVNTGQQCHWDTTADANSRGMPYYNGITDDHRDAPNNVVVKIRYFNGAGGGIFYDCRYGGEDGWSGGVGDVWFRFVGFNPNGCWYFNCAYPDPA